MIGRGSRTGWRKRKTDGGNFIAKNSLDLITGPCLIARRMLDVCLINTPDKFERGKKRYQIDNVHNGIIMNSNMLNIVFRCIEYIHICAIYYE